MNVAFDVGADDGLHGILFAFQNPRIKVFAFEPIKGSHIRIKRNLKKIENFFKIRIPNYKIINAAVSNYNGHTTFYENFYQVGSSLLKPKKKLDNFYNKSKDLLIQGEAKKLKVKKSYKVKVVSLERFCKFNSIDIINYLHIDAQGHDIKVIEGLKQFKKNLIEGVAEVPKKINLGIYNNEQSFSELKKKLKKWNYSITNIEEIQKNHAYLNVYFKTNNNKLYQKNKIIFEYPNKRITRMFKRIFIEKINLKDIFFIYYWRISKLIKD